MVSDSIVTEFVLLAFPQSNVWGGLMLFPYTREILSKVVEAYNAIYRSSSSDTDGRKEHYAGRAMGGLGFACPPPANGAPMIMSAVLFDVSSALSTCSTRLSRIIRVESKF